MEIKSFFLPKESLFGAGCLNGMGVEISEKGLKKALLVTDSFLSTSNIAQKVFRVLEKNNVGYYVFSGVQSNPTLQNVLDGVEAYIENECSFLIALGGGSANDCTKAIGILLSNGGDLHNYQGLDKSRYPSPPIVAINTTAGTASEISRAYLITDEDKKIKMIMKDRNCMAEIAVNDPELMVDLPPELTAATGMDALTHAIESYVSTRAYPLTMRLSRESADCIFTYLPEAVEHPHNINAREQMIYGQYMAGMSFGNGGLGLVHSMAHPLGAVFHLGHGICNAILLPHVCKFNMIVARGRYAELARFLFPQIRDTDDDKACNTLLEQINSLSERIGTKLPLSQFGVTEQDIPMLAQKAMNDGNLVSNPIQPTFEEIVELYRQAM